MEKLSPEDISRAREWYATNDKCSDDKCGICNHVGKLLAAYSAAENERRDADIAKALRLSKSEEEPEEQAPWMVEAEPEPMGPFSLTEAAAALMEMLDREFSKADKRAEAAEAKCDRLKGALLRLAKLVEDGVLVRNTNDDATLGSFVEQAVRLTRVLKETQEALA